MEALTRGMILLVRVLELLACGSSPKAHEWKKVHTAGKKSFTNYIVLTETELHLLENTDASPLQQDSWSVVAVLCSH